MHDLFALVASAPTPVGEQGVDSAKAFLQSVYAHYQNGGSGVDFGGPDANRFFHSSLISLVHEDSKLLKPNEVGVLAFNPVCGCQDWDGIFDLRIGIHSISATGVQADVSFALSAAPTSNDRVFALRAALQKETRASERTQSEKSK